MQMNNVQDISGDLAIQSRLRNSAQHAIYGNETVKLAFGKAATGRIAHVGDVDRGAACSCSCPACGESLVAKQGRQKAWHFAHASGGSCRDALTAGFAAYLVQLIEEGEAVALPDLEWTWGSSLSKRSLPSFSFARANMESPKDQEGFRVRARAPGAARDVIILFRCPGGGRSEARDDDPSILEIDLVRPLAALLSAGQGARIDEAWLRRQVLKEAPRRWLRNAASDEARDALASERLGHHLRALQVLESVSETAERSRAEVRIIEIGRGALLQSPPIRGERFLGPSTSSWRAEILHELIFSEVGQRGFSDRDILRLIGRSQIVSAPDLMRPLPPDDAAELLQHVPDLRRPIEIIRDYLFWLWQEDVIRARPGLIDAAEARGPFDSRLAGNRMPDWIAVART